MSVGFDPSRLRLIVITDTDLAAPRTIETMVGAALFGGAPSIQLRDKGRSVRELLPVARHIRELTREHDALFFVNDRLDLALAVGADGIHLGPEDLPVSAVRAVVRDDFLIGFSADEPATALAAASEGADYLGCGTIWPTASKKNAGEAIGLDGLRRVVRSVSLPVVGIGGISAERAGSVRAAGAAGVAVMSAVMSSRDVSEAVGELLSRWGEP